MRYELISLPEGDLPGKAVVRFYRDDELGPVAVDAGVLLSESRHPDGEKSFIGGELHDLYFFPNGDGLHVLPNDSLRGFPTATVARKAVTTAVEAYTGSPFLTFSGEEMRAAREAGPEPATLELVAEIYSFWERIGSSPISEITRQFQISRSTATRWVRKARDEGYIERLVSERRRGAGSGSADDAAS